MAATGLAEFFIGLGGGMAQGGLDAIVEKEKAAIQAARDEQLARLRMQEHATNKAKDIELADAQAAKERDRTAGVVKEFQSSREAARLAAGATPPGGESDVRAAGENVGSVLPPAANPSKEDDARAFLDFVTARGEKGLTETAMKRIENERKWAHDDDTARRDTERTREIARANDLRDREARDRAEFQNRMLNAKIDGLIGGKRGDGGLAERKFSAKEWSDARKELTGLLVTPDPMNPDGKGVPDAPARLKAISLMRDLESKYDVDPGAASVIVSDVVSRAYAAARKEAGGKVGEDKIAAFANKIIDQEFSKAMGRPTGEGGSKPAAPADKAPAKPGSAGAPSAAKSDEAKPAKPEPTATKPPDKPSRSYTGFNAEERNNLQLQIDRILWTANNTPNIGPEQRAALARQVDELQRKLTALAK